MKKVNKVMIVLIVTVLISNFYLLQQINEVNKEISYLKENVSSIKSDVSNNVNSVRTVINNMVDNINKENRWISPIEMSLGEKDQNLQKVNLSWQIKDYTQGSEVYFYYRKTGSSKFEKLAATNITGSTFGVNIEAPIDSDPEFLIIREYEYASNSHIKEAPIEEIKARSPLEYEYYVEVKNGNSIRASEQNYFNLSKFRYVDFSRITTQITFIDEGKYSITVYEEMHGMSNNKLEQVFIEDKEGKKVDFSVKDNTIFTKTIEIENVSEKINLILKYDTGKTINKEISL